jgi:hypothetical protein
MRVIYRIQRLLVVGMMGVGVCASLPAATIFDNSVNDLATRFNPGTTEVGDEILLAGTDRYLTDFSFEYWGANTSHPATFSGAIQARVQFYQNNGPVFNGFKTPGTSFFDSNWFTVPSPTVRNTFDFTAGSDFPVAGLFMPVTSNMTWSVQFRGMGTGDQVGVDLFSPPVVGRDYPDYWENRVGLGDWTLLTNSLTMDFAAKMVATPEPSALALSVFGGLGLLIAARRLRRKE